MKYNDLQPQNRTGKIGSGEFFKLDSSMVSILLYNQTTITHSPVVPYFEVRHE